MREKKTTKEFTQEEKVKIRSQVLRDTGFPLKRVENYLQRFNWDLKKLYDYPIIKSAVKKTKAEALKAKALEDIDKEEDNVPVTNQKASKRPKKVKSVTDKIGNEIEVREDGSKWFRGKEIINDARGLYAPYLTMKEILKWIESYGKIEVPMYVQKLHIWNKSHKTRYSTWDELSEKEDLKESELIEYENYINWHIYMKRHDVEEFSLKFQKKMKDHFSTKNLGLN